jgi:hypothetical protein
MSTDVSGGRADWYDSRWGRAFYWGTLVATLAGVVLSAIVSGIEMGIPLSVYLFGFLGATVYVFTSFAKRFDEAGRYRLKLLSRTIAVLPLASGVYLLALAFPGISGELSTLETPTAASEVTSTDRLVAGLVFLAGIYVSATLRALGGLADRLFGLSPAANGEERESESGSETRGTEGR